MRKEGVRPWNSPRRTRRVAFGDATRGREEEAERQVRRAFGEDAGRVGGTTTPRAARGHVDVVVADGDVRDDARRGAAPAGRGRCDPRRGSGSRHSWRRPAYEGVAAHADELLADDDLVLLPEALDGVPGERTAHEHPCHGRRPGPYHALDAPPVPLTEEAFTVLVDSGCTGCRSKKPRGGRHRGPADPAPRWRAVRAAFLGLQGRGPRPRRVPDRLRTAASWSSSRRRRARAARREGGVERGACGRELLFPLPRGIRGELRQRAASWRPRTYPPA